MGELQNEWTSQSGRQPGRPRIDEPARPAGRQPDSDPGGPGNVSTRGWILIGGLAALVLLFVLVLAGVDRSDSTTTECNWTESEEPPEAAEEIPESEGLSVSAKDFGIEVWREIGEEDPPKWERCLIEVGEG